MSDTSTSAVEPSGAPVETTQAPAEVPASFGTSRGAGLARGKRVAKPAGSSAAPSSGSTDYRPTAIEIVKTESSYKNPFAPEAPAASVESAPAENTASAEPAAPEPTDSVEQAPAAPQPERVEAPVAVSEPEPKAELNILPPTPSKYSTQVWGETGQGSDPRPVFKPERRDRKDRNASASENNRDARPPRTREPRPERAQPKSDKGPMPARKAPSKKPKGFFGWLKSLFGGGAPEAAASPDKRGEKSRSGSPHADRPRRGGHRRGGRNRSYNGGEQSGEHRPYSDRNGNGQRRHRRGGRNRNRRRPEGQGDHPQMG